MYRRFWCLLTFALILIASNTRAACTGGYATLIATMSPSALWCMNEPSGTTMNDTAGSNPGTYSLVTLGQTALVADGSGNTSALSTAGDGTAAAFMASVPENSTISPANFTVAFWFKYTGGAFSGNFPTPLDAEHGNGSAGYQLNRHNTATTSYLDIKTSGATLIDWDTSTPIFNGSTHFVVFGVTSTTAFASVDGASYSTSTVTYVANSAGNALEIGGGNGGAPGDYQDMAIFSGQLSQANVTKLYNCGHSGACGSHSAGFFVMP